MAMENPPSLETIFSRLQSKSLKYLNHSKGVFIIYQRGYDDFDGDVKYIFGGRGGRGAKCPKSKTTYERVIEKLYMHVVPSSFV